MRKSLLIVLLALLPLSAQAFEWQTPLTDSVTIFETMKINYDITDEDNPFWAGINRLNLNVAKGPFLAGMRYDTEAYFLEEEYYVRYIRRRCSCSTRAIRSWCASAIPTPASARA
jgi:hypothetical protein